MKKTVLLLIFLCMANLPAAAEMSLAEWEKYEAEIATQLSQYSELVVSGEAPPIKCLTPLYNSLIASQPKGIIPKVLYVGREDSMSFTHPTDHFLLHYTDNGSHRVYQFDTQTLEPGTPDYIVRAGQIFESVYQHTINDLGFTIPLTDGTNGGDSRYDVYFIQLAAYGATVEDIDVSTPPGTAAAYLFMENDYAGFGYPDPLDALRVTAAHEFFHMVQLAIDNEEWEGIIGNRNPAWMEMTAVYMEEEHYDDINDYYYYLSYFYDYPQWSLRAGTSTLGDLNSHMYGSVVFPIFLVENFGVGIIKDIWDGCGAITGPNWWTAADQAIQSASGGSEDLGSMFQKFTVWNLFTDSWARSGEYFPEAANYDQVFIADEIGSYPGQVNIENSFHPDNLGANYILLENLSLYGDGLSVTFEPAAFQPWGITVIGLHNNIMLPIQVEHIDPDTMTSAIRISDASQYDRIALIVSVLGGDAQRLQYDLSVSPLATGVLRPKQGDILYANQKFDIQWYMQDAGAIVRIEFSADNGQTWSHVAETDNDQLYQWTIPDTISDSCLILISDINPPELSDTTDGVFSIQATSSREPFPNPALINEHDSITFKVQLTSEQFINADLIEMTVYTLTGDKIWSRTENVVSRNFGIGWNFLNEEGISVAAGLYLAVLKYAGETEIKKFVVLR